MCELSGDLRDGDLTKIKMDKMGSPFEIGGPENQYFSQRSWAENWGGDKWMDRTGMAWMRKKNGDNDDGDNEAKIDAINALKNVTTGASGAAGRAAKFKGADRKGVTKKSLVIKKPKGYS